MKKGSCVWKLFFILTKSKILCEVEFDIAFVIKETELSTRALKIFIDPIRHAYFKQKAINFPRILSSFTIELCNEFGKISKQFFVLRIFTHTSVEITDRFVSFEMKLALEGNYFFSAKSFESMGKWRK